MSNTNFSGMERRQALSTLAALAGAAATATATVGAAAAQAPAAKSRKIVVTIDDGPATGAGRDLELFRRIANGIRESFLAEKVPAILFVNENQLNVDGQRDARVEIISKWLDAGLDLGNHTYSHPRIDESKIWKFLDDVVLGEVISRSLLAARNKKLEWFRYPYLATGNSENAKIIEDFLERRGYKIAPVSVDYADYSFASTYSRFYRAGQQAEADAHFDGVMKALDEAFTRSETQSERLLGYELPQTLLIHCNEMNSLTLKKTIERIRNRGYTFVSMNEAMSDPAYQTPNMRPGAMGGGGVIASIAFAKK